MGRYPTFEEAGEVLDPQNPLYQELINKTEDLKNAEDDWYRLRRNTFDEYDFGDFNQSTDDVERKYDQILGDDPWNYTSRFESINPSRTSGDGQFRLVADTFSESNIQDGFKDDIFVRDLYDEEEFVKPEDRRGYFGSPDPAPRVLNYEVGRGKGRIDTLYTNLEAFENNDIDRGDKADTLYYIYDDYEEKYVQVDVFEGFSEIPIRYNSRSGYSGVELTSMHAAGNSWDEEVRPALNAYKNALDDYKDNGGGDLDFDYLGGTLDRPWDNYIGQSVSYNKPRPLPNVFVRQVRGVPNTNEA